MSQKRDPQFQVYQARDGWRWRLRAANGRIVATGEAHTRKADAVRAAANLPGIADEADHEVRQVAG